MGPAEESLFRELTFFGGHVPRPTRVVSVPARRWRVDAGRGRLRAQGLRLDLSAPAALSWRPLRGLRAARTLRLALRGPAGLRVRVPLLGQSQRFQAASDGDEPGIHIVAFDLPEDWMQRLDGRALSIELDAAESGAWFEGADFVVPARAVSPGAVSPEAVK